MLGERRRCRPSGELALGLMFAGLAQTQNQCCFNAASWLETAPQLSKFN